jgi:hypothetical protein
VRATDFENMLVRLQPNSAAVAAIARHDHLSPAKRALLLRRLQERHKPGTL